MLDRNSTCTPIAGAAALVTGANRGFGRAVVDELIDRGAARGYATARSQQTPRDKRIVPLSFDVTDDDSVAAAARAASDVSIVVNNARISLNTPVLDVPLPDIRAELETNLFGTIRVARAFSPGLPRTTS
jgi:NAD(P)-dependent dehydrogenase (short-subunit alcohol dehydrogenase family)